MSNASTYLHGARRFRVIGAVVVVRADGREQYLYRNAVLPADVAAATVDHLLRQGLIAEVETTREATT